MSILSFPGRRCWRRFFVAGSLGLLSLLAASRAVHAQSNDIVLAVGGSVTPSVPINRAELGPNIGPAVDLKFDSAVDFTVAGYHRFANAGPLGIYGGISAAFSPNDVKINQGPGFTRRQYAYAFVTPELLVKLRNPGPLTPWASVGAGLGDFLTSNRRLSDPAPVNGVPKYGNSNSATGAASFGVGVDLKTPLHLPIFGTGLGLRFQVKDYLSGQPDLSVPTTGSTQNTVVFSGGLVIHL